MAKEIYYESDLLKVILKKKIKTLTELNEDFRRSDFISLSLMSSDILRVITQLLNHES